MQEQNSCMLLQACAVCCCKDYKRTVLEALPKLKNLDGERNPLSSTCFSALVEHATKVQEEMMNFKPDFKFTEPKPWIDAGMLQVPAVPPINHFDMVSALYHRVENRATWLVQEISKLSMVIQTKSC